MNLFQKNKLVSFLRFVSFFLVSLSFLTTNMGCDPKKMGSEKKIDYSEIPEAIIGVWENTSVTYKGVKTPLEKPRPESPFDERNNSEWVQLKIDKDSISLVSTDFVTYFLLNLKYKIEKNEIITIDTENSEMTDFKIHGFSKDNLSLEFINPKTGVEDEKLDGFIHNFKRIKEVDLAYHTAQVVTFTQNLDLKISSEGQEPVLLKREQSYEEAKRKRGAKETMACTLGKDKNLEFSLTQEELLEKDSENQEEKFVDIETLFSVQFKDLKLELKGPSESLNSKSQVNVLQKITDTPLFNDLNDCHHEIQREGAIIKIATNCENKAEKINFNMNLSCILIHKVWNNKKHIFKK